MVAREKIISADEFWELSHSADDELRRDLIDGVVYEMSPAGEAHGVIALKLGARILEFVEAHQLGRVTAAETGYAVQESGGQGYCACSRCCLCPQGADGRSA